MTARLRDRPPAFASVTAPAASGDERTPREHRLTARAAVTVAAAIAVLTRLTDAWPDAADTSRPAAIALLGAAVVVFAATTMTVVAGSTAFRTAGDVLLLAAGVVVAAVPSRSALFATSYRYPSDEGRLVQRAIATLSAGHDPYRRTYPSVAHFAGNTPLFGGGGFDRFGYPPLMVEIGAALRQLWAPAGTPATVGALALLAAAVVTFGALPTAWRGLAVLVVLGLEPLTTYAVNGHPAVLATAFLCAACCRWSRIGAGGRLGRSGVVAAGCLGAAAAAQQLAWLPALGLLLAVWLLRRGNLPARLAVVVVTRFAAVAVAVFAVANLPFLLDDPRDWLTGLSAVAAGQPVAAGQGLVMFNVVMRGQGGDFAWYSYAAGLALVGVLAVVAVGFGRTALLVPVLLAGVFLFTTRSQGEYVLLFTPVWLVWIAGTDMDAVASARPLFATASWSARWRRLPLGLALIPLLGALACVGAAVSSDGPLDLRARVLRTTGAGRIDAVQVVARNLAGRGVRPHFYLDPASHLRSPWRVVRGPHVLPPGAVASFVLRPALLGPETATGHLRVWALADGPTSISSAALQPQ